MGNTHGVSCEACPFIFSSENASGTSAWSSDASSVDSVTGVSTKVGPLSIAPAMEEYSAEEGGLRGLCTDKGDVGTYERFMGSPFSPFSLLLEEATVAVDSLLKNDGESSLQRAKT